MKQAIENVAKMVEKTPSELLREVANIVALAEKEKEKQEMIGKLVALVLMRYPDMDTKTTIYIDGKRYDISFYKDTEDYGIPRTQLELNIHAEGWKLTIYYRKELIENGAENFHIYSSKAITAKEFDVLMKALNALLTS